MITKPVPALLRTPIGRHLNRPHDHGTCSHPARDEVVIYGALQDITVEVVRRNPDDRGKGFVPQPKRWIVEQVNGTLMLHRRLAREYDHRPDNAASRVYWTATANVTRRLTTPPPTWRDDLRLAA